MDKSKWEYKKLGEVAQYPKNRLGSEFLDIDNYVGVENLLKDKGGRINALSLPTNTSTIEYKENDILIGNIRPYLKKIWFADRHGGASGDVVNIRVKENYRDRINPKFLYCVLSTDAFFTFDMAHSKGAKMPRGNKDEIVKYSIPLPPIADQQRIVAELDCLNEMIALKQAQLKEFDKLAQSIFYDMFGEGYNTKFLGDFCEVGTGATPDRKKVAIYYGGNVNWVKTTEVHNCDIYETEERITDIALEQTNCKVYYPGAILMAMYGQGKTRGQVARLMTKAATNQACAAIIPDTRICDKDYLYIYLLLSYEKIRNMARGGNQANLNLSLVKMIPVPLPPLALQQQFAEKIQAIEAQKELVKQSIAETQQLLASRMDYYFD